MNNRALCKALMATAAVAVIVMALTAGVMLRRVSRGQTTAILEDAPLAAMRQQLAEDPDDVVLRRELRARDHARMREHFSDIALSRLGTWVLLGGAVVLIGSLLSVSALEGQRFFRPVREGDFATFSRRQSRVQGAMVALLAVCAAVGGYYAMPAEKPLVAPVPKFALDSKRFRGNDGSGHVAATFTLPDSGQLAPTWSTRLPLPGKGSAVAVGDRLFVSAATASSRKIVCMAASTGRIYWDIAIPASPEAPDEHPEVLKDDGEEAGTGYAAASMAADGERVYALFANGDLAAVNFDGRVLWSRHLLTPKNQYGLATSPIVWGDRVVVQFDQTPGEDDEGNEKHQSKLFILDAKTGGNVHVISRDVPDSWTTPLVVSAGERELLVTSALPWVIAYDRDGNEAWRVECMTGDVAPSPTCVAGRLFVTMEGAGLFAIDPVKGEVLWEHTDGDFPDIVSPLATKEYVWTLTTSGVLRCFDAASGKELWKQPLAKRCYASPMLLTGGTTRVLIVSADGEMLSFAPGETFVPLAEANLGETVYATPLVVGDTMLIRGRRKMMRVDSPSKEGAK
ncbi:MAG: PQQ-like beta-propeller repeat protein [Phycisphaerales bacterium]|jgi:outer membrane protein assembly factor BamB|nr:PQQ-like beta-propeller repeat protein [Phycisphaerales bacterium]MBT7171419.1 PQQ-like beta-propeller repeat protein [Phycisphaerales bacterium]